MSTFNKALIAALALQVALALITLSRGNSTSIARPELLFPNFNPEEVERIEVYNDVDVAKNGPDALKAPPSIVLAKKNGAWVVETQYDYPVGDTELQDFFNKLKNLTSTGPIATATVRQSQLKVAPDRFLRKAVLHRQGRPPLVFYVGQNAGPRRSALRLEGSDEIHGTSLPPSGVAPSVTGWIDNSYFRVEAKQVAGVSITNPAGTFSFERDGMGGWKPTEGTPLPGVDMAKKIETRPIDNVVRAMAVVQAIYPADPEIPTGSPLATVTLTLAAPGQDGSSQSSPDNKYTFVFGPEREGRYMVRRSGETRAVWVSMNQFEPVLDFGPKKLQPPLVPQTPPDLQAPQEPQGPAIPTPSSGNPHGGTPRGGNLHGGNPGGNPHGGTPRGGNPHGGNPHQ